jgi:hypothetical protein
MIRGATPWPHGDREGKGFGGERGPRAFALPVAVGHLWPRNHPPSARRAARLDARSDHEDATEGGESEPKPAKTMGPI